MPTILISYRREDTAAYAGRIADRLKTHFGRDNVFVDVDTIRPGEDFIDAIDRSLRSASVVIALIGRNWLNAADASGRRRLDRSDDFVRTEIAKALASRVRVIPALVGNAVMPEAKELPEDLQPLTRRQAIEISDTRFHQDVDQLIQALADIPAVLNRPGSQVPGRLVEHSSSGSVTRHWLLAGAAVGLLIAGVQIWRFTQGDSGVYPPTQEARPGVPGEPPDPAAGRADAVSSPPVRSESTPPRAQQESMPTESATALRSDTEGRLSEVEPNTDILHPNLLPIGVTVRAAIRPVADKDFFRIRAPGNTSELRVVLTNRSKLMPEVKVWDSALKNLKSEYRVGGDLYFSFVVEAFAEYILECAFIGVNQNNADPEDSGAYELTVLRVK